MSATKQYEGAPVSCTSVLFSLDNEHEILVVQIFPYVVNIIQWCDGLTDGAMAQFV